jgi:hypothetical protein
MQRRVSQGRSKASPDPGTRRQGVAPHGQLDRIPRLAAGARPWPGRRKSCSVRRSESYPRPCPISLFVEMQLDPLLLAGGEPNLEASAPAEVSRRRRDPGREGRHATCNVACLAGVTSAWSG